MHFPEDKISRNEKKKKKDMLTTKLDPNSRIVVKSFFTYIVEHNHFIFDRNRTRLCSSLKTIFTIFTISYFFIKQRDEIIKVCLKLTDGWLMNSLLYESIDPCQETSELLNPNASTTILCDSCRIEKCNLSAPI